MELTYYTHQIRSFADILFLSIMLKRFSVILLVLCIGFVTMSIINQNHTEKKVGKKIQAFYLNRLNNFSEKLDLLKQVEQEGKSEESLIRYFLTCRNAFKEAEFLLMYADNTETLHINGANIKINEYTFESLDHTKDPHGLQLIEDLLYNPSEDSREVLRYEIDRLDNLIKKYIHKNKVQNVSIDRAYHIIVWDALRYEIYRIESLGITGFDVPDSENSLPETKRALSSVLKVIELYKPIFRQKGLKTEHKTGTNLLKDAIEFVDKNQDFNSFDRLTFIKNHLHKISDWLTENTNNLDYNYFSNSKPLHNEAYNLFSKNIFNDEFFVNNPNENARKLGEKLFFDTILSGDNNRNCATCHNPNKGFADGLKKNLALDEIDSLQRNTPSLWNSGYQTKQFYDSRVTNLEFQSLDVIHNKNEMNGNLSETLKKLKDIPEYKELYDKAYNGIISELTTVNAIAVYVLSLKSFDSRFDKYIRGESDDLTESEKNGFNIFAGKGKCATCHFIPMFNGLLAPHYTDTESEILGVPVHKNQPTVLDTDLGKYQFTKLDLHKFAFKTPTVRNIEFTAPYMHNGVFETLEEVVDFYNKGGGLGQGMILGDQTLPDTQLELTEHEITDLINFMKSLNDTSVITP